jgi:hypothetical protein
MYAYLSVFPRDCDIVEQTTGEFVVVARGDGDAARVAAAFGIGASEPATEEDLEAREQAARVARRQEARREWQARLDQALDASTSISHARMIREAFMAENPEPAAESIGAPEAPQVQPGRWWCARLEDAPGDLERWLADAGDEYPRVPVARVLSELRAHGWEVRHVSEEKVAVHDGDSSRAEVVGAWFLLEQAPA